MIQPSDQRRDTGKPGGTPMNTTKNIILAATLSVLSIAHVGAAQAADTIKPLQGISFHVGNKDAVAYFLTEGGSCKLVLTMAEDVSQPARVEIAIATGQATRYELTQGKLLEFACKADGLAMEVNSLPTLAGNGR
jgi:hypothetical protein